ncbi:VCBS repeat-containing protein [Sphingomonas sp. DG1-23]|uniref:VCBS repeat-containing protein n=1 Tax=Sphingomonas sp. DG1-23 TaxID=3068316 RepID=UPI00273EA61E|nr:VCBS repeat-containing protein [Sphingomonas sp. DG1-23]MDP5277946.1 VCBS repeat-containing protein [Sphingomonas sp. DG1-23]
MVKLLGIQGTGPKIVHNRTLTYTVTFSEPVTGVTASDFVVKSTGTITGSTVTGVTAVPGTGGSSYTVTVQAGVGLGDVSLGISGTLFNGSDVRGFVPAFTAPAFTATPLGAREVSVGDLDGDGKLDLIVSFAEYASPHFGQVAYFKGKGDGTFGPLTNIIQSNTTGTQIDIGDVNGDGKLDIAIQLFDGNQFSNGTSYLKILLGDGAGGLLLTNSFTMANSNYQNLMLRDLNHDGRADLVSLRLTFEGGQVNSSVLSVRLSDAGGAPGSETVYNLPGRGNALAMADVNGDGKLDAVVGTWGGYSVLFGNGNGTFQPTISEFVLGGVRALAVGDVNGDGLIDLVYYANDESGKLRVLLGNGNGPFALSQTLTANKVPTELILRDMNGDGTSDLIASGFQGISLFVNSGTSFEARADLPLSTTGWLGIGDLDGNGTPDFAFSNPNDRGIAPSLQVTGSYHVYTPNDFDGDGRADILWRGSTGATEVWEMNGVNKIGGGNTHSQAPNAWAIQASGDFNGDGKADILWRNDAGSNAIWLMDGAHDIDQTFSATATDWKVQGAGDFNGDGTTDILWRNSATNSTEIWLMRNGVNVGGTTTSAQADASWKMLATDDFDGDGKADVLLRKTDGTTRLWFMDGTAVKGTSGNTGPQLDNSWTFQSAGDFNGDSKADILWRNTDGRTQILFMDGKNTVGGGDTYSQTGNAWQVEKTDDYNGDGKADILWRNTDGSTFVWLMDGTNDIGGGFTGAQHSNDWFVY